MYVVFYATVPITFLFQAIISGDPDSEGAGSTYRP